MIKLATQHSYFEKKPNKQMGRLQNNPWIGWVHPKSAHVCLSAWGNKKSIYLFFHMIHGEYSWGIMGKIKNI